MTTTSTSASAPAHPHVLVRWFVQYNPMFTASALSVLGGVFLLARALGDDAALALTGVLELYQWLLIGVAALLYRRLLERRPAVILGVIELALLVDPTLQLSALATAGEHVGTAAWLVCFAAKIHALAWAFRLRTSLSARWLPIGAAAVVALIPGVRVADVVDASALRFILAGAVFVLGWAAWTWRPVVESRLALSEHGLVMFPRLVRAAAFACVGGFVYQACNASLAEGLHTLLPSAGALLFVVAAKQTRDAIWLPLFGGAMLCVVGGGAHYAGAALAGPLAFIALLLAARANPPRVLVAAVACGFATSLGVLRESHMLSSTALLAALALFASVPLAYALVKRHGWSALPALAGVHVVWTRLAGFDLQPHGAGQWGLVLVAAGFVLLPLGVVAHRRLSRVLDAAAEASSIDAPHNAISTSAAVPLS
jgi:hypothetical protein